MTTPRRLNVPPADVNPAVWAKFMAQVQLAQQEPVPAVNVVPQVLQQLARQPQASLLPREGTLLWAAGISSLIAASLLITVWTAVSRHSDPSQALFPHLQVALLEGP